MDGTASARLIDWEVARRVGGRVSGAGPKVGRAARAELREEFAEVVGEADHLVTDFTGLRIEGPSTRPWVMSRGEWIGQNLRGFETILDPLAERVLRRQPGGLLAGFRRKALATQLGALLGYLGRRVLGQYDLFLPPDDRDLLYFVGPNVVSTERRFGFSPRDFRAWLAFHEVTHRVQFSGVPWLRPHLIGLVNRYLDSIELDARRVVETLRRAVEEARGGSTSWRGLGVVFLLMTPEQRELFQRMQSAMSLLEGHGNYVMAALSEGRIEGAERMRRVLRDRRHSAGVNRMFQKAIGLDVKVRQYDIGERFVAEVVAHAGAEGFARVWERPEHLPTLQEVARPEAWVERVVAR